MRKITFVIFFLLFIYLTSMIIAQSFSKTDFSDKIMIIPIYGVIGNGGADFFSQTDTTSSSDIVKQLENANQDKTIKAIILEINSPGGTVVSSKEITEKVKSLDKPVVAWIRDMGASGAYWIASGSDVIVADEMSITGSIGVVSSYLQFSELMEEYGIEYERLVAGNLKDAGSPYKELTAQERTILQNKINLIHRYFIEDVAKNRNVSVKQIQGLADGMFYLGIEAQQLGLVDVLGGEDKAIQISKQLAQIDDAKVVKYQRTLTFIDLLRQLSNNFSFNVGLGIGESMKVKQDYNLYAM